MDQEIMKLVEEFVRQIESKESDLVSFKREINTIVSDAQKKMNILLESLDVKFETNGISEEEYLMSLRKEKENILEETKNRLDSLVKETKEG